MEICTQLEAALDGRLEPGEEARFGAHLADCLSCRARVEAWKACRRTISAWNGVHPAPSEFAVARLVGRARGRTQLAPARPLRQLALGLSLAAVAAAVVVTVFWRADEPAAELLSVVIEEGAGGEATVSGEKVIGLELDAPAQGRLLARVGGDHVAVLAQGRVRVARADSRESRFELRSGSVAVEAAPRVAARHLDVVAGGFTVRVIGTRFLVGLEPNGGVGVSVARGVVEVRSATGRLVRVLRGQRLRWAVSSEPQVAQLGAGEEEILARALDSGPALEAPVAKAEAIEVPPDPLRQRVKKKGRGRGDLNAWRELVLGGQLAEAEASLSAHLRRAPKDFEAWSLLADCRRKAELWGEAVAAYRQMVAGAGPAEANRARFFAASILQDHLSDDDSAAALLRDYLGRRATYRPLEALAMVRLARAKRQLGETEQAKALLREVLERHQNTEAAEAARRLLESW